MKKVLAVFLTILMVFCMNFSAFAKTGEFIQSPSNNKAPILVDHRCDSEDCYANLIITAFQDRANLPKNLFKLMEKAYKDIANCKNLADLCFGLAQIALDMHISELNLSVSDLFDIRYEDCETHDGHGYFQIVLKAETFKNFVALIHLSDNGWEVVEGAEVKEVDGEYYLTFRFDDFSPFAIVVNSAVVSDEVPNTGDNNVVYFSVAVLAVAAFAVLIAIKKVKKQTV